MNIDWTDVGTAYMSFLVVGVIFGVLYVNFIGLTVLARMFGLSIWEMFCVAVLVQYLFKSVQTVRK